MKIIVPMAGKGSRMAACGRKPFIDIRGRPMVAWACDSVSAIPHSELMCVVLAEDQAKYGATEILRKSIGLDVRVVLQEGYLPGQLCSVLQAREFLDGEEDLLIASADTYVVSCLATDIAKRPQDCKGMISVASVPGDRWSFARTAEGSERVLEIAEKRRISDHASTGLYYFSRGCDFLKAADEVIERRHTTDNEYYVSAVYQAYMARNWAVYISRAQELWDMGTPDACDRFRARVAGKS